MTASREIILTKTMRGEFAVFVHLDGALDENATRRGADFGLLLSYGEDLKKHLAPARLLDRTGEAAQ